MNYINVEHPVGSIRFFYDEEEDAAIRCKVTGIVAVSSNATAYTGDFTVQYQVQLKGEVGGTFLSEDLHNRADKAFPELPAEAANAADQPEA